MLLLLLDRVTGNNHVGPAANECDDDDKNLCGVSVHHHGMTTLLVPISLWWSSPAAFHERRQVEMYNTLRCTSMKPRKTQDRKSKAFLQWTTQKPNIWIGFHRVERCRDRTCMFLLKGTVPGCNNLAPSNHGVRYGDFHRFLLLQSNLLLTSTLVAVGNVFQSAAATVGGCAFWNVCGSHTTDPWDNLVPCHSLSLPGSHSVSCHWMSV